MDSGSQIHLDVAGGSVTSCKTQTSIETGGGHRKEQSTSGGSFHRPFMPHSWTAALSPVQGDTGRAGLDQPELRGSLMFEPEIQDPE